MTAAGNMDLKVGDLIDKRYQIDGYIAEGGFGTVYKGRQIIFGETIRPVAIKIIKSAIPPGKEREIFAEAILQLGSEDQIKDPAARAKLARVYDFGIIPGQRQGYIIMELIVGSDLQREIDDFKGPMPEDITRKYIIAICEGMAAIHRLEVPIIHRDLKPENVLLTPDKEIKIADFGLAVRLNQTFNWAEGVAGTQIYMAPETLTGVSFTQSDVFSIGVMWYRMLTARLPFDDEAPPPNIRGQEVVNWRYGRRKSVVPPSPRRFNNTCSERISDILMQCLAFEHASRYRDAADLLAAIRANVTSREECLRLAEQAMQANSFQRAAQLAAEGLSLASRKSDKTNFLFKMILAQAYANLGSVHSGEAQEKYYTDAARFFLEVRNENETMKWLTAPEAVTALYQSELDFHRAANNSTKIRILERKIQRLQS